MSVCRLLVRVLPLGCCPIVLYVCTFADDRLQLQCKRQNNSRAHFQIIFQHLLLFKKLRPFRRPLHTAPDTQNRPNKASKCQAGRRGSLTANPHMYAKPAPRHLGAFGWHRLYCMCLAAALQRFCEFIENENVSFTSCGCAQGQRATEFAPAMAWMAMCSGTEECFTQRKKVAGGCPSRCYGCGAQPVARQNSDGPCCSSQFHTWLRTSWPI